MKDIDHVVVGSDTAFISAARVLLGLFLLGTGVATFFVPELKAAFTGQLNAAGIPLQRLSLVVLPVLEGIVGVLLIGGVMIRIASFVSILLMTLLTYLHIVVHDPAIFPLQFGLPLMPIVGLVLGGFLYFVETYIEEL